MANLLVCRRIGVLPRIGGLAVPSRSLFGIGENVLKKRYFREKIVPVPIDIMFEIAADVDSYKKFLPFCVDSSIPNRYSETEIQSEIAIGYSVHLFPHTPTRSHAHTSKLLSPTHIMSDL
eukprot:c16093_g1_i1.p1 GENE.c16093_g1_i1~~c16093_g1_i1.p1  ORF type:complete len:135 (+),score=30.95 c16093_g1_i1:48-407(+)